MPEEIINAINDAIGGFFGNPVVQFAFQALAIYIVILWLAAASGPSATCSCGARTRSCRTAAALIVLFTPVLFVFGIIVHRIVRPHEKIGEVYERNLAEEALLAEVEAIKTRLSCRRRINDEWIICPTCTQLNRRATAAPRRPRLVAGAWCGRDLSAPTRGDRADLDRAPERTEPSGPPAALRSGGPQERGRRPPAASSRAAPRA
jgi:hypothetical protein